MRGLLLLCLLPVLAPARELRLLRLEGPEDLPSRLFVIGEGVEAQLDLPLLTASERRATLGSEARLLYLAKDKPSPRQPLPADAPSVRIPAGTDDLLLVLLQGPGALGLRASPVALPDARASAGALVWFNLQPRGLTVRLGAAAPVVVPPGSSRILLPPVPPGSSFPASLDLAAAEAGADPQPFVRTTWVRARHGRHLYFVVADPDRIVPRIISVPDVGEPEPPAPPAAKPDARPAATAPVRR